MGPEVERVYEDCLRKRDKRIDKLLSDCWDLTREVDALRGALAVIADRDHEPGSAAIAAEAVSS